MFPKKTLRLAFEGPAYPDESNRVYMTIRAGEKWIRAYLADNANEVVALHNGVPVELFRVVGAYYLPLRLAEAFLAMNYDPEYFTLGGAINGLRAIYGDVDLNTEVTILFIEK